MITLQELIDYLKIPADEQEAVSEFLKTGISFAKSFFSNECNRSFEYSDENSEVLDYDGCDKIYLRVNPITDVTAIKYYSNDTYSDLIETADIETSIRLNESYFKFRSYQGANELQITYKGGYKFQTLTGTISASIGTATVTGSGTAFTTELEAGDKIMVEGFTRTVLAIGSNTSLTVTENFPETVSAVTFILNTYPDDIRLAVMKLAAYHYQESSNGNNLLYLSSKNVSLGGGTGSDVYKKCDIKSTVEKYRFINI